MNKIILILLFAASIISAQSDWARWDEKQISYEIPTHQHHDYALDNSNISLTMLSLVRNAYYFFISDLDGDNCPFSPSCSAFFIESVKETSILKGTLMFADRFTRDLNLFKGQYHYQLLPKNKYYDPTSNYTLYSEKIKF
jgi:putative component of membrane protein insertase Oxa1/YidC/SpoIIIJ protein YidD